MTSSALSHPATMVVVDDHPIVLAAVQGICMTIGNLEFVGASPTVGGVGALIQEKKPSLAIVDMNLSDGDGFDVMKAIHDELPNCRVLIFSAQEEPAYVERALKKGAQGYLLKGGDIPDIRLAIETVLSGKTFISPELAQVLACRQVQGVSDDDPTRLMTNREFQVFQHLGSGKKSADIAEILSISPRTVDTHRENLKNKLNCQNSTEVIIKAREWASQV